MTGKEVVAVQLEPHEITRIDRLARRRGVERGDALIALVRTGLTACERALEIEGDSQGIGMSDQGS